MHSIRGGTEKSTFQDREEEIREVCAEKDRNVLLNVYGEAGIGKSRLLDEAKRRIEIEYAPTLVLKVDLGPVSDASSDRPQKVLRSLAEEGQKWIGGRWRSVDHAAGQIVAQLNDLAGRMRVHLMFDTTETLQEDMDFWRWMEEHLVGPLAVEGRVRQVFAGRVPVPWRRIEVRRAVKLLSLGPLPPKEDARDLAQEVLARNNPDLKRDETLEQAVDLTLDFSFAHPMLTEELAAYVAPRWPISSPHAFRRKLCEDVVRPFIDEFFFDGVERPWGEFLWWASALDRFDATILQRYLERIDPTLVEKRPDYFFIQGIGRLRIRNTVVWREKEGDRLYGVIRDIVQRCFEVTDPDGYARACQAAADTLEALVDGFPAGGPEAQRYLERAETYRERAQQQEVEG